MTTPSEIALPPLPEPEMRLYDLTMPNGRASSMDYTAEEMRAYAIAALATRAAPPEPPADALTAEQRREIADALPKVGESENVWTSVRGSTLRALAQEARPAPAALSKFVRSSEKEREAIGERVAESAIKAQQQVIEQAAPASPEGALLDAWRELGRFFMFWVGSALYEGSGEEVDLEGPYEAFRTLHAALAQDCAELVRKLAAQSEQRKPGADHE